MTDATPAHGDQPADGRADLPGRLMASEIAEQPTTWQQLIDRGRATDSDLAAAADLIGTRRPRFVQFVARGTSDHAALYAKYVAEIALGLPCGLVSPSTLTAYGAEPDLREVLMIAVSQSGGSPDLVRSLEAARANGALTVAVTNNPSSELAGAAEAHVDIAVGTERAVAATKSYTGQLLALHLLLDRVHGGTGEAASGLPEWGSAVLDSEHHVAELAQRYRFASRLVTTARGYSYPTAREAALKLMETCYLGAQAFSGADLLHGPLAMIDLQVPVLTVVADGIGGRAMGQVLPRLAELGADVFCFGSDEAVGQATTGVALPAGVPEEISPVLEIIPFQQLARHLAVARGGNPDQPRGLKKVTETI